jgi:hypothetical protein
MADLSRRNPSPDCPGRDTFTNERERTDNCSVIDCDSRQNDGTSPEDSVAADSNGRFHDMSELRWDRRTSEKTAAEIVAG